MKHVSALLAWAAVALIGVLAALNWSTLMVNAPLNLVVAQIEAPLGVVMLGLTGVLLALFFVAHLRSQIGSMLETRKLVKEVQRAHDLADKAEASRLENLHQLIATEFRLLNERIGPMAGANSEKPFRPMSRTEIVTGHERP